MSGGSEFGSLDWGITPDTRNHDSGLLNTPEMRERASQLGIYKDEETGQWMMDSSRARQQRPDTSLDDDPQSSTGSALVVARPSNETKISFEFTVTDDNPGSRAALAGLITREVLTRKQVGNNRTAFDQLYRVDSQPQRDEGLERIEERPAETDYMMEIVLEPEDVSSEIPDQYARRHEVPPAQRMRVTEPTEEVGRTLAQLQQSEPAHSSGPSAEPKRPTHRVRKSLAIGAVVLATGAVGFSNGYATSSGHRPGVLDAPKIVYESVMMVAGNA